MKKLFLLHILISINVYAYEINDMRISEFTQGVEAPKCFRDSSYNELVVSDALIDRTNASVSYRIDVLESSLVKRDGIAYKINSTSPYTGMYKICTEGPRFESRVLRSVEYQDGREVFNDGIHHTFDQSGLLRSRSFYKNGKLDGLNEIWNSRGQKTRHSKYENGELLLEIYIHKNGQISRVANYKNGKKEGLSEKFAINGAQTFKAYYLDGKLHGTRMSTNDDGTFYYSCWKKGSKKTHGKCKN